MTENGVIDSLPSLPPPPASDDRKVICEFVETARGAPPNPQMTGPARAVRLEKDGDRGTGKDTYRDTDPSPKEAV